MIILTMAHANSNGTKLKVKKIKGRMTVLRVLSYNEHMIYVRFFSPDIFTYDLIHNNQLFSSYLVISPSSGRSKLSKTEITEAGKLVLMGAMSTVDSLIGVKLDDKELVRAAKVLNS